MSLEDKIQDRLVSDAETVLENHLDDVEEVLQLHQDGTIVIENGYRDVDGPMQVLIYLIGQRYAFEGGIAETPELSTGFFYGKFEASDRTVRNWLQKLRETGLAKKSGQSDHELVIENLPDALDRIKRIE